MLRLLHYLLMSLSLLFLIAIYFMQAMLAALRGHPRVISGSAGGASAVVRWYCNLNLSMLDALKRTLGRYLNHYHRPVYLRTRFLLIPRR